MLEKLGHHDIESTQLKIELFNAGKAASGGGATALECYGVNMQ